MKLKISDNGLTASDAGAEGGAGGNGGVGGEGPGGAVSAATVAVLTGARAFDPGLSLLYPYDKTVWPRGVLAPLVQWKPGAQGDYDAVYIKLSEASFDYDGFFARTATPFVHHPIPQAAWKQLLASNAGEDVTVTLVFAKGGAAYGPVIERWKVASAPLKGIVYYNSYGTRLAKNFGGAVGGDGLFGAATLAIKAGGTDCARRRRHGRPDEVPRVSLGGRERLGPAHAARPRRPEEVQRLQSQDRRRDDRDARGPDRELRVAGDLPRWLDVRR